jgi:hypothetical protein
MCNDKSSKCPGCAACLGEDTDPLPTLQYGDERREKGRQFQILVLFFCTLALSVLIFWAALCWARGLMIGTNLPLPPYSVDEATGEVMK